MKETRENCDFSKRKIEICEICGGGLTSVKKERKRAKIRGNHFLFCGERDIIRVQKVYENLKGGLQNEYEISHRHYTK